MSAKVLQFKKSPEDWIEDAELESLEQYLLMRAAADVAFMEKNMAIVQRMRNGAKLRPGSGKKYNPQTGLVLSA